MKVELRERTPECRKAYFEGYESACNILRQQMLDKMEYYRSLLRMVVDGRVPARECGYMITEELGRNPEFEVLDHMPYGVPMCCDPDAYKAINTGPEPK